MKKKDNILTEVGFQKLLELFDPVPEKAGLVYLKLRQKLAVKFGLQGSVNPEDHADEVLDRVARRVQEGLILEDGNYEGYFFKTAKFVFLEYVNSRKKLSISLDDLPAGGEPSEDPKAMLAQMELRIERELGFEAIRKCRNELSPDEQSTFDFYFAEDGALKHKERREALAQKLAVSLNTLKTRASRIREKLLTCARRKMSDLHSSL